jgi:chromate transporter
MPSPHPPPAPDRPRPASLADLFCSVTVLALQGFGGVLAVVQRELVERKRWLTQDEFIEDWAVAQIMPGPNVVNLSMMIGARYFGLRGAMAYIPLPESWLLAIAAVAFVLLAWLRVPLVWVLPALGGLGCVLAWRKLRP